MDKEQYLEQLEKQNGYCDCPELKELFTKRKYAEGLEAKCNFFERNVDLNNPLPEDKDFLEDYKNTAINSIHAMDDYHHLLDEYLQKNKVKLLFHSLENPNKSKTISLKRTNELVNAKENPIITYNCSNCEQQIDILDTEK